MAKPVPKASRSTGSVFRAGSPGKTPAGVWVIVGMALFFLIGGIGVSAFIVWKAVAKKRSEPVVGAAGRERPRQEPGAGAPPSGEVGLEHPNPNSTIDEAGPSPAVVSDTAEQDQTRQEVLKRIDLMKGLSDTDKDKLYAQVERARGFTKIGIIPFTPNRMTPPQMEGLIKSLHGPDLQKLLTDPTVILIMVGYADKQGDEAKNVEISRTRAESVVKVLREKTELPNIMHAVGMGAQDLINQSNPEKNRLVEVWAVQP